MTIITASIRRYYKRYSTTTSLDCQNPLKFKQFTVYIELTCTTNKSLAKNKRQSWTQYDTWFSFLISSQAKWSELL